MNAKQFSHYQYGAPLIQSPERVGGRYCLYRFHGDNPVTFTRYLKSSLSTATRTIAPTTSIRARTGIRISRQRSFRRCQRWQTDCQGVVR